jgi:hypothetical protein
MWGVRSRHKDSGGNGAGGRQVWLHELVEAITTALIAATRPIQEQHIAVVQETFALAPETPTSAKTESKASEGQQHDYLAPKSEDGSRPSTSSSPGSQANTSSSPAKPAVFRPETVLMELPANGGETGGEGMARRESVVVPTAALMQSNALVIDEATIELECIFNRFATEADGRRSCASRLGVWLDRTGSGSPARIVIKFKRVDRPEGASRIEDALLRNMQ